MDSLQRGPAMRKALIYHEVFLLNEYTDLDVFLNYHHTFYRGEITALIMHCVMLYMLFTVASIRFTRRPSH